MREQDEREDLSREEDAPERNHASGLDKPIENVANINHCSEDVLTCDEVLETSEEDETPEVEAGEQEILPDVAEFQELPALAAEVIGLPTINSVHLSEGDVDKPANASSGASDEEKLDQGRLAFWFPQ